MPYYPQLITFLIAMTPVSELRGAIPVAIKVYGLSPIDAFIWAGLGNLTAAAIVLFLLEPLSNYLSHHFYFFNRFFAWLFERTRRKHTQKFEIWGALALASFVAIPLPFTGAWTGAVAAFVFGVPLRKSIPLISIGVVVAGIIVTLITEGFF